jgi:hypothetical protein
LCDPISTWRIVSRPSLPVGSSTARESALLHGGLHTRERVGAAKERKKRVGAYIRSQSLIHLSRLEWLSRQLRLLEAKLVEPSLFVSPLG